MLKIEIPQMYETKTSARKARNRFINLIVVLLIGIYGVHQTEEMFVIMGWTMIVLSSLVLLIYVVDVLFFYLGKITYKFAKKSRNLHYKTPQFLKDEYEVSQKTLLRLVKNKGKLVKKMKKEDSFIDFIPPVDDCKKHLGAVTKENIFGNVTNVYVVYQDFDGNIKYYDFPR